MGSGPSAGCVEAAVAAPAAGARTRCCWHRAGVSSCWAAASMKQPNFICVHGNMARPVCLFPSFSKCGDITIRARSLQCFSTIKLPVNGARSQASPPSPRVQRGALGTSVSVPIWPWQRWQRCWRTACPAARLPRGPAEI